MPLGKIQSPKHNPSFYVVCTKTHRHTQVRLLKKGCFGLFPSVPNVKHLLVDQLSSLWTFPPSEQRCSNTGKPPENNTTVVLPSYFIWASNVLLVFVWGCNWSKKTTGSKRILRLKLPNRKLTCKQHLRLTEKNRSHWTTTNC